MKAFYYLLLSLTFVLCLTGCEQEQSKEKAPLVFQIEQIDSMALDVTITSWYENKSKAIAFTWDDNVPYHKEVAEMFNKHGLKTTFFINTGLFYRWQDRLKHPFNLRNYKRIAKKGHEIGTHTDCNKNYMLMTREEAERQMILSSERVHDKFGYWPATMSHPTSHYDETIDSLMALHYIDSRYSVRKDNDFNYRFLRIRTSYPFSYYKSSIDSFAISTSSSYVYGGHSMDGKGYEPIPSQTLDSLLTYIQMKYSNMFWISSFDDLAMYEVLYKNVSIVLEGNCLTFDIGAVKDKMDRFEHPQAIITVKFTGVNLDFFSDGLEKYWYDGRDSYANIDLRRSNKLYFKRITLQ